MKRFRFVFFDKMRTACAGFVKPAELWENQALIVGILEKFQNNLEIEQIFLCQLMIQAVPYFLHPGVERGAVDLEQLSGLTHVHPALKKGIERVKIADGIELVVLHQSLQTRVQQIGFWKFSGCMVEHIGGYIVLEKVECLIGMDGVALLKGAAGLPEMVPGFSEILKGEADTGTEMELMEQLCHFAMDLLFRTGTLCHIAQDHQHGVMPEGNSRAKEPVFKDAANMLCIDGLMDVGRLDLVTDKSLSLLTAPLGETFIELVFFYLFCLKKGLQGVAEGILIEAAERGKILERQNQFPCQQIKEGQFCGREGCVTVK